MIDYQNDEQKRENLIHFIKVTQQIIDEEGIKKVSIRRIAALSGFHNSTIYLYFKDLNELIMLASIMRFQEYSEDLEKLSHKNGDAYDNFFAIWEYFCEASFQYPCVFFNFFFGKYSDDLPMFLNVYYDLFPDEKNKFSADIEAMYFGKNYTERCMKILLPLVGDKRTSVTSENIELINDISVSYCKDLLEQKCSNPQLDSTILKKKILDTLHFLIDRPQSA